MRRSVMIVGLMAAMAALTALPGAPSAQARDLPGALLGVITRPLGAIFGGHRVGRRGYYSRRGAAARSKTRAVQSKPAVPAAAAAGAAGAAAVGVAASGGASPVDAKVPGEVQTEKLPAPVSKPLDAEAPKSAAAASVPSASSAPETAATPAVMSVPPRSPSQQSAEPAKPERSKNAEPAKSGTVQPVRLGATGPLTWSSAFEDVIGFTFWPGEYSDRLRAHGIGDVLNTVMVPASALAARIRPGVSVARADADKENTAGGTTKVCALAPASSDWPVSQLERSADLSAEQRATLVELKAAIDGAVATIRAACREEASLPAAERLRAMQSTLWAVHDATIQLRGPIAKFYSSLSEEQQKKFAAPAAAQADPGSMTPAAIARLCGAPQSNDALLRQAEQALKLTSPQRASLDTFQKKAAEMGQFLMASCLRPVASTPTERLDAAVDRLTALIFAASTVDLAMSDLYNQLDAEQKSKFEAAVR